MGIMRYVIKKCDELMGQAYAETDNRKAYCKAFTSGAIEGFCDAAIIAYPLLMATLIIANKADKNA